MAAAPSHVSWEKGDKQHWLLRNIPFLAGLLIQTISLAIIGSYQLAKMDARIVALESADVRMLLERDRRRAEIDVKIDGLGKLNERMIRTETTLDNVSRTVTRIENKLDRAPSTER